MPWGVAGMAGAPGCGGYPGVWREWRMPRGVAGEAGAPGCGGSGGCPGVWRVPRGVAGAPGSGGCPGEWWVPRGVAGVVGAPGSGGCPGEWRVPRGVAGAPGSGGCPGEWWVPRGVAAVAVCLLPRLLMLAVARSVAVIKAKSFQALALHYTLESVSGVDVPFHIHPDSGVLSLTRGLRYVFEAHQYHLTVRAGEAASGLQAVTDVSHPAL